MKYLSTLILIFLSVGTFAQVKIIHAGTLLATPGTSPKSNQTIVIEGSRITDVQNGFKSAQDLKLDDAEVIDLKGMFVMPGFIDMHTHITGQREPARNPHEWTTLNDMDAAFEAIPHLSNTLRAGFTTVRNTGSDYRNINAIKRAISKGLIEGPRIIAATGGVTPTGGHGDFHGYRAEILNAFPNRVGVCDGADDCARAVRALVKQGADVIKITATGGVLSNTAAGVGQQLTDDEMVSIVKTANSLGRKVIAHAHESDGINAAIKAGVASIEHGSYLTDESVKLFLEHDTYLVPTLMAGIHMIEELSVNPNIPPAIVAKVKAVGPEVEAAFKRALKGGVKIAFGTDSGVSPHGQNAREFELMVNYGMKPADAIKAATVSAADLLGMSSSLGTLEKGKFADIVAVEGDPIKDISLLKDIGFVMKEGKVYKN